MVEAAGRKDQCSVAMLDCCYEVCLLEDVLVRNELWQLGPCSLLCWLLVRHASVLARGCLRWKRVGKAEAWWQVEPGRGEWAKHAGR